MLLLAHSLQPSLGGISQVARLMARAAADVCPDLQAVTAAGGSRLRFVWNALLAGRRHSHVVYDACHLAQVHRLPPLRGRPSLVFLHGIEIWEGAKRGYIRAGHRATMQVVNSEFTRRKADRLHGGFDRARVCWLATEGDDAPAVVKYEGPPEVLIVGRMVADRDKGHRALIACWPRVVAAVPDAVLRVVGQGPYKAELERLAGQSSANIVFQGFVPDAELEAMYGRATVYAMPSRGEGFGLVYIEAMRHGLPVVGSVHDAAGEVIRDGETGYLVDLDRDELAERLIALLRDRDAARRLGEAGRERWRAHFRYSAFKERFTPLLREFLAMR